jgi:hypothetical protein
VYLFTGGWAVGLVLLLPIINKAALNVCVWVFAQICLGSLGYFPGVKLLALTVKLLLEVAVPFPRLSLTLVMVLLSGCGAVSGFADPFPNG